MKVYIVSPGLPHGRAYKEDIVPIKGFTSKDAAEKFCLFGIRMSRKFTNDRYHCDRLRNRVGTVWDNNRCIKTDEKKYWMSDKLKVFEDIFWEELKDSLTYEEKFYHYKYCEDNNLKHIRCYDSYEIYEMDVEEEIGRND